MASIIHFKLQTAQTPLKNYGECKLGVIQIVLGMCIWPMWWKHIVCWIVFFALVFRWIVIVNLIYSLWAEIYCRDFFWQNTVCAVKVHWYETYLKNNFHVMQNKIPSQKSFLDFACCWTVLHVTHFSLFTSLLLIYFIDAEPAQTKYVFLHQNYFL